MMHGKGREFDSFAFFFGAVWKLVSPICCLEASVSKEHPMRWEHTVFVVALVACVVTFAALWGVRAEGRQARENEVTTVDVRGAMPDSHNHALVIAGFIDQPANAKLEPEVVIGAYIDGVYTGLQLSTAWSGLYVPNTSHHSVTLAFELQSIVNCSGLADMRDSKRQLVLPNVAVTKVAPAAANVAVPMLGIGAAKLKNNTFASPLLAALDAAGLPVAWAFSQQFGSVAITLRTPLGPCFDYCWVPLGIDTDTGEYSIALAPTATAPYTRAIIAFGRWLSLIPRAATAEPLILKTSTADCSITLRSDTYTRGPTDMPADVCVLGASAGLQNALFAIDVTRKRFGIVMVIS